MRKIALLFLCSSIAFGQYVAVRRVNRSVASSSPLLVAGSRTIATAPSISITTPDALNIADGDTIVAFVAADAYLSTENEFTCGSNALTRLTSHYVAGYMSYIYYKLNATAGSTTCTANYSSDSAQYRAISVETYRGLPTTGVTVQIACNNATCDALADSSQQRTAQNVTTTHAKALLLGIGYDWEGGATYNAATNGYTLRIDPGGVAGATMWMADRYVTSTGTYPSGSFASTTSTAQTYGSFIVAFSWD